MPILRLFYFVTFGLVLILSLTRLVFVTMRTFHTWSEEFTLVTNTGSSECLESGIAELSMRGRAVVGKLSPAKWSCVLNNISIMTVFIC